MADTVDRSGQRTGAYKLTWRGREIEDRMNEAVKAGMIETLRACVDQAKIYAPVRTGALRDDIDFRPPQESNSRITGRWGNWTIRYSIFQEYGTVFIPAVHYLGRSADEQYPLLDGRIERHYNAS